METGEKVIFGLVAIAGAAGVYIYIKDKKAKVVPHTAHSNTGSAPTISNLPSPNNQNVQAQTTSQANTSAPGYGTSVYNWLMKSQPSDAAVWNVMSVADLTTMYNYDYALQNNTPVATLLPLYSAALSVANNYGLTGVDNTTLDNYPIITKAYYWFPGSATTNASSVLDVMGGYANAPYPLTVTGAQMDSMAGTDPAPNQVKNLAISYTLGLGNTVYTQVFKQPSTGTLTISLPASSNGTQPK